MTASSALPEHQSVDPWLTPDGARQLAAAADYLYQRLRHLDDVARHADADPARHAAGYRLDVARGGLRSARDELQDLAEHLQRLEDRPGAVCPVPSGVCPEHGGTLRSEGAFTWCTAPRCGRQWDYARLTEWCTELTTHHVVDLEGGTTDVCTGHAVDVRRRLVGATVTALAVAS